MNIIYIPQSNKKMVKYNLKFNKIEILEFINQKSLEFGATKSENYYDKDLMREFESIEHGEEFFYNGRLYQRNIHEITNYVHDFWNGESYDVKDYILFMVFYNEKKVIPALIKSLEAKKDIIEKLSMKDVIINYNWQRIFEGISLESYLLDNSIPRMISFDELLPFISTDKQIIIEVLNRMEISDEKTIDYNMIKDNILDQIKSSIEICEKQFLTPMGTNKIEKSIIGLLDKKFNDTLEIAKCNEKVLSLIK